MDRTVPSSDNEELALYIRTYYSLLRSTRAVEIRTLIEAHARINSALHVGARDPAPDMAAFIYTILRLPDPIIDRVRLVVMAQSEAVFAATGYPDVEAWATCQTLARRRRMAYDGRDTLAVYIASRSDIDDLIPTLTTFEIERDKMHQRLADPALLARLASHLDQPLTDALIDELAFATGLPVDDMDRLRRVWGSTTAGKLLAIGRERRRLSVRLLSGSLADYRRATRRWWQNVARHVPDVSFEAHPLYFVSSNTHSLANLLSGYGLAQKERLIDYVRLEGSPELKQEFEDIRNRQVPSSAENFLYYTLKKLEADHPSVTQERLQHESATGLMRIESRHVFDVEVHFVALNRLQPETIDPRLCLPGIELLSQSNALLLNIDFPLGMAAYQILTEVARNVASIRGIYIMGKAATLNGRIGDVMIPSVVHDEHSRNTYLFQNCLSGDDVAPHLVYGSVLDNQKAITVRGTFLQNREYMSVFYQEGYTDMEMEAGPYLSSIYEMVRPQRHPVNELVNLYQSPFPIGILHYASDTPFSKGKNLGAQNLSYFGMDPTYACSVAILRSIIGEEIRLARQGQQVPGQEAVA